MDANEGEYKAVLAGNGYWEVRRYTGEVRWGVQLTELVCMLPFGPSPEGKQEQMARRIAAALNTHNEEWE